MSISLVDVFKYYEGLPHQDSAIQHIEDALETGGMKHWLSGTSDFVKLWRNSSSPDDERESISLVNAAKLYRGLPRQDAALLQLQQSIEAELPELWDETSDFARIWRQKPLSPQPDWLITFDSIGLARLGMTIEELKLALGTDAQFQVQSPFMVGFDAIAATLPGDNKAQYYIVYPSETPLEDSDEITMLITENPKFRTAEGIGPGVLVSKAIEVYGAPTFSYSAENESREWVKFVEQDQNKVEAVDNRRKFRPQALCYDFAGIYLNPTADFNETNEFQENACIWQVWLIKPPTDVEAPKDSEESGSEVDVTEPAEEVLSQPEDNVIASIFEVDVTEPAEEVLSQAEDEEVLSQAEDDVIASLGEEIFQTGEEDS